MLSHYGETAEAVVVALADTMAGLGSFSPGQSFVVLAPEHVTILARDGWTKRRLREALYARARRTRADLKRGGKLAGTVEPADEAQWVHRGTGPDDICLVVAGGGAGGHSAFIPSWSRDRNSLAVTRFVTPSRRRTDMPLWILDPTVTAQPTEVGARQARARPRRKSAGSARQRQGQR